MLSLLPDEEIDAYLEAVELKPIADKDKLYETIRQARAEGCTIGHSELENYTSVVAVPVYNNLGEGVAGHGIAGIEANYMDDKGDMLKEKVRKLRMKYPGNLTMRSNRRKGLS